MRILAEGLLVPKSCSFIFAKSILLLFVNDIQKTKTGKSQSYYIIIVNLIALI